MSTSKNADSKAAATFIFGCCGVLMNPLLYGSAAKSFVQGDGFVRSKTLVGGTPLPPRCCCYHRSIYWHHSAWTCTLPAVPFMPNALGTTASTIQLTLTTYLVADWCRSALVWTAIGPTGAPPRSTGRWPRLRCGVNGPRSYVIGWKSFWGF